MDTHPIEVNGDLALFLAYDIASTLDGNNEPLDFYLDISQHSIINLCAKPNRNTLLHEYIKLVCEDHLAYYLHKGFYNEMIKYMTDWLDSLGVFIADIPRPLDNSSYSKLCKYAHTLQKRFLSVLPTIAEAVFTILYSDKDFLYRFNYSVTEQIKKLKKQDYPDFLEDDGYLKRAPIPVWLKKGVFYRDRGRCQCCGADLSWVFQTSTSENYDHIIPLRQGGSNDPTNFQLLCEHCNKAKRDRSADYKNIIWPYWNNK